jgi:hypothetical protein
MTNHLFDSLRIATVAFTMMAVAGLFSANLTFAETKQTKQTREEIAAACEAADGVGFGYLASSGSYGCVTDNAWIDCDEDGNCKGGVVSEDATKRKGRTVIKGSRSAQRIQRSTKRRTQPHSQTSRAIPSLKKQLVR